MTPEHAIVAWYRRFFDDITSGDAEGLIAAREAELNAKLPPVLRAMIRHTSFRNSSFIHLRGLDQIEIDDEVLLFADEQQGCGFWGIRTAHLGDENPKLVFGSQGLFADDGCGLEEFLRYVVLANRLYESPCATELVAKGFDGWERVDCLSQAAGGTVWVRGEAAATDDGPGAVGARTNEGLHQALEALGQPAEADAEWLQLANGHRFMPSHAEQVRQLQDFVHTLRVVPPELHPILGVGPVSGLDLMPALHQYCRSEGLEVTPGRVHLDAPLETATGLAGEQSFEALLNALNRRLTTQAPPGAKRVRSTRAGPPPKQSLWSRFIDALK